MTAPFDQKSHAAARAPQKYFGKYAGTVLDNTKPTDSAHRGDLLVEVPGILEENPTGPGNRALQVTAQPSFLPGFFFIPEPQAPVWVEFVAGDINFPIWTGVWYPTDGTPDTVDSSAPTEEQKVIRTPSGHVIQLDDTSGSEQLVVMDETNQNTVTLDSQGLKLADGNGNTITLDANGITLMAAPGKDIVLETANAKVDVSAASVLLSSQAGKTSMAPATLAPVINWLTSHQHIGNMGAPAPLNPGLIAMLEDPTMKSG